MADIGTASIYLILLLATWAAALAVVGARRRDLALVRSAQLALYAVAACASLSALLLIYAFVVSDFSLVYVQQHSERSMPLFYRVTAMWGGMEGSMLLWVVLLSIASTIAVRVNQQRLQELIPYAIAVLMTVVVFFAALMVTSENPFETFLIGSHSVGKGLNPLLQNPYMVTHPPSLYAGFVMLTIPFAFAFAALLSGHTDDAWLLAARPWALAGWYFLSLGLTLGMLWAYEELGWGGYWGWDPVENAGFMPWLLATAFLHSVMVQERRQMLKKWNIILATLAFVMTIFGTFLTRSGFIDSVHAFARSNIGYVFLAFIAKVLLWLLVLIIYRWRQLRSRGRLESMFSREFWFLLNNWVLLKATVLVLVLTTFPTLSEWITGNKITISIPAFNRWMVPIGIVLLVLTGIGPMLGWRKTSFPAQRRQFLLPTILNGIAIAVLLTLLGAAHYLAVVAWGLSLFVTVTIAQEVIRGSLSRARAARVSLPSAMFGLIGRNRRRYGGYIVHLGIVSMCVGFAGETLKQEKEVLMRPGQRIDIGRYTLRYDGMSSARDDQKVMINAQLTAYIDGRPRSILQPARWIFDKHEDNPTTEVAIKRSFAEDLFVAIGGYNSKAGTATFKIVINPLVNWIWIGFLIMTLGTIISAIPGAARAPSGGTRAAVKATGALIVAAVATAFLLTPDIAWSAEPAKPKHVHEHKVDRSAKDGPVLLSGDGDRERSVFSRFACMCGGCPKIPLDRCPCGFANREREAIRAKLSLGWSDGQIIAWYTEKRGQEIGEKRFGARALTVPPDSAFNRLAWLVPYAAGVFAVLALVAAGRRWRRAEFDSASDKARADHAAGTPEPADTPADDTYSELLDRELDKLR